ncbi:hypothetical protein CERSUDRAFT_94450 [Gelatoporia subvermispora B]|uniref:Uncharacterized protein n=1 Tax=Ceriporiopsis subvermispora (strain B) TaxID=914234 RepID=M2PM58_CERS8|nr:hypothetical protein CERSUDRAFT_94450 [Gelatoporia subvermispora B]
MHCLALKQRLEQSIDDNICMHLDIRQIVANMFLHHNHIRIKRVALSVGIDICADSMGLLDGICVIPREPAQYREEPLANLTVESRPVLLDLCQFDLYASEEYEVDKVVTWKRAQDGTIQYLVR